MTDYSKAVPTCPSCGSPEPALMNSECLWRLSQKLSPVPFHATVSQKAGEQDAPQPPLVNTCVRCASAQSIQLYRNGANAPLKWWHLDLNGVTEICRAKNIASCWQDENSGPADELEAPPQPHSFESTVQPALNALSLDSLRDMRGRIEFRIRELEQCGKHIFSKQSGCCLRCGMPEFTEPTGEASPQQPTPKEGK